MVLVIVLLFVSAHFLNIDVEHVRYHRNFCNKIWQAFKYTTSHLGEDFAPMSLRNLQVGHCFKESYKSVFYGPYFFP